MFQIPNIRKYNISSHYEAINVSCTKFTRFKVCILTAILVLTRCFSAILYWLFSKCHVIKISKIFLYHGLVILKLDLELIATECPFAPNNYFSDPNQHIKSLPKSTRRKIVNLPEHFQLLCIISKGLLACVFWNVKKAQLKINVMK